MKKRFNIDDYKGKYVMHCDTEAKALVVTAVDFVPPKTIISWSDGSTTVVKCTACTERGTEKCVYCEPQSDWRESGIIHAMCKKAFSKEYFRVLDEYCEEEDE